MTKAVGPDDKIPCPTVGCLLEELEKLEQALDGQEREDTWERFERGILRFAAVTRGGAHKFTAVYVEGMGVKGLGPKVVECMLSDRGRLSGVATDFLTSMAPRLGVHFTPLIPLYLPPTIRLLARPNKVYLRRAEKCVMTIITHCATPALITLIKVGIEDKNEACRRSCGAALEKMLRDWEKELVGSRGVVELEVAIKRMATEKDAEVRKIGKRMWEVYTAKWPERIEGFTAPLTPTIKKYLEISQTKSSVAKTLFPAAPAARARHPLSQTTIAPSDQTTRPAVSRHVSASVTTSRDRNLQAIRGLGRSISTDNASGKPGSSATANGIRPFLLRSASAALPSSTAQRTGLNRSVSVANVFGNGQLEEEDAEAEEAEDGSTEDTASIVSATRPRVITHASAPDLHGSSSGVRAAQAQRAAGTGAVRRARVVSGLTQVTEGRTTALGMGRPQGAVRPNGGRVVSSSATIGVGARGAAAGMAPVKPRMVATGGEKRTTQTGVPFSSDSTKLDSEAQESRAKPANGDAGGRPAGVKVITTNPGGTTKTRQFFRPTPTSSTSTSAALNASTQSNTSANHARPVVEPRRVVSRTAGTGRPGGLTAPTASSGAKVVHRVPVDALVPEPTCSSNGALPPSTSVQQPQAKPIVSPRKPRQKLKPPLPAFMPTSKGRAPGTSHGAAATVARPKVRTGSIVAAVEPASVPLPESPAPIRVTARIVEDDGDDPFAAAMSMAVVPIASEKSVVVLAMVPAPPSPEVIADAIPEEIQERETDIPSNGSVPHNDQTQSASVISDAERVAVVEDSDLAQAAVPTAEIVSSEQADEESILEAADVSHGSVMFKQKDNEGLGETLARASASRALESATPIEVNLIDLDGPELEVAKPVAPSPAKRTPLGPASPNQMVPRKVATPKTKSPKIKQLSEFFENKAFSPSPSPERTVQLAASGRRPSTTPLSTPPRPRVLS